MSETVSDLKDTTFLTILDRSERRTLGRLCLDVRRGVPTSDDAWKPFEAFLLLHGYDRRDPNDVSRIAAAIGLKDILPH